MIPKRVTLENFLSYGPKTVIEFTDDEPLWVLGGPNGVGKSAVFDAITYCLFARHRGGKSGHDELKRHGTNGFTVGFEFEFAGADYRIVRNRTGARPTQSVELKANGVWKRVPDLDAASAVDAWVERTIGLSFDAFTASVLLRQGEADKVINDEPADRLKTLKKIIGVERYEALSERVTAARKGKESEEKRLREQKAALTEVTIAEVTATEEAATATAASREAADAARRAASAAVPLARQWANLCVKRDDLTRRLTDAAARAADADRIRADHARLGELSAVVPVLQKLIPLRGALHTASQRHEQAAACAARLRTELDDSRRRAEGLRLAAATARQSAADLSAEVVTATTEHGRQAGFLTFADEIAALRATVATFPATLEAEADTARTDLLTATTAERAARDAVTETVTHLRQATDQQARFGRVEIGVTCSECGQEVTAGHAEKERNRLADRIAELTTKLAAAREALTAATTAREAAGARLAALSQRLGDRDRAAERLVDRERSLTALGGTTDADAIRAELVRLDARRNDLHQRQTAARAKQLEAEAELKSLDATSQRLDGEVRQAEAEANRLATALARDTAARDTLLEQLPAVWHETADAGPLAAEREALAGSGVERRFRELEQDDALRSEWDRQRQEAEAEIDTIPDVGRIPSADAETLAQAAEGEFGTADAAHRAALLRRNELARRRKQWEDLRAATAHAANDARIHATLDELLGKRKLQRELIRDAEAAIVRLAHGTLDQLSGGELSVALADPEDGADKALDLLVRRADDPTPIPVKFLSGSQKFRVAISVALAIGRFASGQARPLESVIIDEGFGSLDKDGLRAAADELNRLKDHLRRIILVSHQEEFTDHFPVVIRLSKGEHGTTAEQVRQRR